MKVKNNQTKFYASPFIMIGLIIMLLLMFGIWTLVFIVFVKGGNEATTNEEISRGFIIVSIYFAISLLGFALTCHKGFTVYQLTNDGIRTSLFRIFKRKELMWDEVFEIRHIIFLNHWIFISDVSLEGMNYQQIIKLKNVIQIESNKKLIDSIRQYSDKQIINLPNQQ
jgi:hypothetical protein